jgi:Fe-S cluster assembly iron-binding protein IscA
MLQITPQAEQRLLELRTQRGLDAKHGVRFLVNSGSVGLTFADAPMPDDRLVEGTQMPIYVAHGATAALDDALIDTKPDGADTALVIRRQRSAQAKSTNGD